MQYPIEIVASVFRFFIGIVAISLVILFWGHVQRHEIMNDAVTDFCDQVRYKGVITADMYDDFLKKVSVEPVKITMHHRQIGADGVVSVKTEKEILQKVIAGGYDLKAVIKPDNATVPPDPNHPTEDDFYISVSSIQPSLFYRLLSVATQSAYSKPEAISKGGMVYK